MTKRIERLKQDLEDAISVYVAIFCKKHDLSFEGWAGDKSGEIGQFGDYYFDFSQIRYDLETDQPKDNLIKWYDYSLELAMQQKTFMNYETWCKTQS